jgi:hypothetical protein
MNALMLSLVNNSGFPDAQFFFVAVSARARLWGKSLSHCRILHPASSESVTKQEKAEQKARHLFWV